MPEATSSSTVHIIGGLPCWLAQGTRGMICMLHQFSMLAYASETHNTTQDCNRVALVGSCLVLTCPLTALITSKGSICSRVTFLLPVGAASCSLPCRQEPKPSWLFGCCTGEAVSEISCALLWLLAACWCLVPGSLTTRRYELLSLTSEMPVAGMVYRRV